MLQAVRIRVVLRLIGCLALGAVALPAVASAHRVSGRTLRPGMRGSDVRSLQRALSESGFRVRLTGVFNAATTRTIRRFERRYHLAVDGIATPALVRTLNHIRMLDINAIGADTSSGGSGLGVTTTPTTTTPTATTPTTTTTTATPTTATTVVNAPSYGKHTLRKGMHGRAVKALQSYLTLAGFATTVDGQFGPTTKASVVAWEEANGITPANGVVTPTTAALLKKDVSTAITSTTTTTTATYSGQATLNSDGTATAPANAPAAVVAAIAAANSIIDTPYIYGGGHASFTDTGYDCSGAVSFALHGGGLLSTPEDSSELETYGQAGPGSWITIYSDPAHAFVVIAGLAFDTAHYGQTFPAGSGPRWLPAADVTANLSDGGDYVVRHPVGY